MKTVCRLTSVSRHGYAGPIGGKAEQSAPGLQAHGFGSPFDSLLSQLESVVDRDDLVYQPARNCCPPHPSDPLGAAHWNQWKPTTSGRAAIFST